MMEKIIEKNTIESKYPIEKEKLKITFERLRNFRKDKPESAIIAQFLNSQGIELEMDSLRQIIEYYEPLLVQEKDLFDFSIERIRAQKIRNVYLKALGDSSFLSGPDLAVDTVIFNFLLKYDAYIRPFFESIEEYQLCALYNLLFTQKAPSKFDFKTLLNTFKDRIPTIFIDEKHFPTRIFTLRAALSEVIKKDSETITNSKIHEKKHLNPSIEKILFKEHQSEYEFGGKALDRIITTFFLNKESISKKEVTRSVSEFLDKFFKLGVLYSYTDFKIPLQNAFSQIIYYSLSKEATNLNKLPNLTRKLDITLNNIIHSQNKELDGLAWKNDLLPILTEFLVDQMNKIFSDPYHFAENN